MANQERHIRIYDLHSWTGISLGIMLFVVCFTGCIALFYDELKVWEDPAQRLVAPSAPAPIHDRLVDWVEDNRAGRTVQFVGVTLPGQEHGYYETNAFYRDADGESENVIQRWNAADGSAIQYREKGANRFLYDLHRDLAWPEVLGGRQVGRALVGIVGVAFLLIILSGIIAHTKITKELFTLRYLRSVRLKWQDSHKVLGLWTTPFASMIALTGAFLGIVTLLGPLMAAVTVKGDLEKLTDALGLGVGEPAGIEAPMISVDTMMAQHPETGQPLARIFINHWGDANAQYTLNYPVDDRLVFYDQLKVSGVSGEPIENRDAFASGDVLPRTLAAFSPLHYGTYGGIALKLVYLVLGLALAIMAALGNMMWIERRLHGGEGRKSKRFYRGLSALTTGVCAGLPLASVTVLGLDKLYTGAEAARYATMVGTFFILWLATLIFAWFRGNDYKATRELLAATGIGFAALAPLNWITTGDTPWSSNAASQTGDLWFDLAFVLMGALCLLAALKMPGKRPADKRRKTAHKIVNIERLAPAE